MALFRQVWGVVLCWRKYVTEGRLREVIASPLPVCFYCFLFVLKDVVVLLPAPAGELPVSMHSNHKLKQAVSSLAFGHTVSKQQQKDIQHMSGTQVSKN